MKKKDEARLITDDRDAFCIFQLLADQIRRTERLLKDGSAPECIVSMKEYIKRMTTLQGRIQYLKKHNYNNNRQCEATKQ